LLFMGTLYEGHLNRIICFVKWQPEF
jgi:hypothetical protein